MAAETVSEIESEGRQWFTVASSWVAAVGFDTSSCEVMVRLLNGKEYTTQVGLGEAEGIAMSIASAGSVGQAVNHFWGP
jgi:hypothetical protein